jgi:signal transduction histidine kinase
MIFTIKVLGNHRNQAVTVFFAGQNTVSKGCPAAPLMCNPEELYIMRRHPWLALAGGFGGLLLIMAAAQLGTLFMINGLRNSSHQAEQRFLERSRILEEIRSSIYLSGTVARDSLLAPTGGAPSELAEVNRLHQQTNAALAEYRKSLEPEESAPFASLRSEIEGYWQVLNRTFAWTDSERKKFRYQFFYSELVPRRTVMLQIADQVGQLNERVLLRGDEQVARLFETLRLGLMGMLVLTLIGGLALATYASAAILRLQDQVRARLEENIEAKKSLRELSAKLLRAQEEERRALSRELHDEAGQSFSAILLETENLLDTEHGSAATPHLLSIRNLAQRGMAETRNMALLLRPSMLDDFGLVPALNWQAKETAKRTGLKVQMSAAELPRDLPEEHKTCIYRVVQEALNNVVRHAQASAAHVRLQWENERINLIVQDDGTGFDAERVRGLGLLGMEERVHHLGGVFTVDSHPGRGTLLTIQLPVAELSAEVRDTKYETNPHPVSRRS